MIITVVGSDGSGKSTLAANLLNVFWNEHKIPTQVIAFPTKEIKSKILVCAKQWMPWQKASAFFIDFARKDIHKEQSSITILDRCWICTAIYQGFELIKHTYGENAIQFIKDCPDKALQEFVFQFLQVSDKFFDYQDMVYVFLDIDHHTGAARETDPNYFSNFSHGTSILYRILLKHDAGQGWRESQQSNILTFNTGEDGIGISDITKSVVSYCIHNM